jgi:hypothetical protein
LPPAEDEQVEVLLGGEDAVDERAELLDVDLDVDADLGASNCRISAMRGRTGFSFVCRRTVKPSARPGLLESARAVRGRRGSVATSSL